MYPYSAYIDIATRTHVYACECSRGLVAGEMSSEELRAKTEQIFNSSEALLKGFHRNQNYHDEYHKTCHNDMKNNDNNKNQNPAPTLCTPIEG